MVYLCTLIHRLNFTETDSFSYLFTDDDLLQDLFSRLSQIESSDSEILFKTTQDTSAKTYRSREGAGKIKADIQKHSMAIRVFPLKWL